MARAPVDSDGKSTGPPYSGFNNDAWSIAWYEFWAEYYQLLFMHKKKGPTAIKSALRDNMRGHLEALRALAEGWEQQGLLTRELSDQLETCEHYMLDGDAVAK